MKLNKLMNDFNKLCQPSKVYLVASFLSLIYVGMSNLGRSDNNFCVAGYGCKMNRMSSLLIFVVNALVIVFHSWVLNLICKAGYKNLSWGLVLMPFILFVLLFLLLVTNNVIKKLR